MLQLSPLSSLLLLTVLQGAPLSGPSTEDCEDLLRIERSPASNTTREICISPGLLTGFVFDSPVMLEIQDEARFTNVLFNRMGISFMPPNDLMPGERLRLTARYADGNSTDSLTFILVGHPGQATRQIEVFRDKRSQESYQQEVLQEQAKNRQLQSRVEQLQHLYSALDVECGVPQGLRRLIASNSLTRSGIKIQSFSAKLLSHSENLLTVKDGDSYHSDRSAAIAVQLLNVSTEPWKATGATLVDAQGKELTGTKLWQDGAIAPQMTRLVVVEMTATVEEPHGEFSLTLKGENSRDITLSKIWMP